MEETSTPPAAGAVSPPRRQRAPGGKAARGAQAVGRPSVWKSLAEFTRKGYAASVRRQSRQRLRSRARRREKMEICFLRRHVRRRKHFSGRKCGICPPEADKSCARRTVSCSKKWLCHFFDSLKTSPGHLLMCDKEAIEVQKILPFLSDTWPLCRIGRAVIRASQSCRQSCNKSQCPACGCRSRHSCTHARRFSQSFPARGWGSIPQRQGAFGRYP